MEEFHRQKIIERLKKYAKINSETGCWDWSGTINNKGYPVTHIVGRIRPVARLMAALFLDLRLDDIRSVKHVCGNKRCFNPSHLTIIKRSF